MEDFLAAPLEDALSHGQAASLSELYLHLQICKMIILCKTYLAQFHAYNKV